MKKLFKREKFYFEEFDNKKFTGKGKFLVNGDEIIHCSFKDGIPDGPFESFYLNGNKKEKSFYKNGKLEGDCEDYFEDGTLQYKEFFKNGYSNGEVLIYHPNGELHIKMNATMGIRNGIQLEYSDEGVLISSINYKDDLKAGPFSRYYKNGKLWKKGEFIEGWKNITLESVRTKSTPYEEYYETGILMEKSTNSRREIYDDKGRLFQKQIKGIKDEEYGTEYTEVEQYYENGQLECLFRARSGTHIIAGKYESFFSNGNNYEKFSIDEYGRPNGTFEIYFKDGLLKEKGIYRTSIPSVIDPVQEIIYYLDGNYISYYPDGLKRLTAKFKDKKLVERYKDYPRSDDDVLYLFDNKNMELQPLINDSIFQDKDSYISRFSFLQNNKKSKIEFS